MKACATLVPLLLAGAAMAHPLDEVVQGAYLTLLPGAVRLELDLTPGELVADALLQAIDANVDRTIAEPEAWNYAERVLLQSTLLLDGAPVSWRLQGVDMPAYADLRLQGATLKIHAFASRADRSGKHTLRYENHYQPAASQNIANVFLQPGARWRYEVAGQQHGPDGRVLDVDYVSAHRLRQ